jgi:hypothetical protein
LKELEAVLGDCSIQGSAMTLYIVFLSPFIPENKDSLKGCLTVNWSGPMGQSDSSLGKSLTKGQACGPGLAGWGWSEKDG